MHSAPSQRITESSRTTLSIFDPGDAASEIVKPNFDAQARFPGATVRVREFNRLPIIDTGTALFALADGRYLAVNLIS